MKIYKIGRDQQDCDIIIDDPSGMTSRVHAVIKINKKGKYSIADCSSNGTYVNGIKIESGVEVPVTRKDRISFAHVVDLDWRFIPNPAKKRKTIIFSILAVIILICAVGAVLYYIKSHRDTINNKPEQPEVVVDTTATETPVVKDTVVIEPKKEPAKKAAPAKAKPAEPVQEPEPEKPAKITNPIL